VRRYVDLHPARVAVVFTQYGTVLYSIKSRQCSSMVLAKGDEFSAASQPDEKKRNSVEIELELRNGSQPNRRVTAWSETLFQRDGFAMTLIEFESDAEIQDDEED
jgi:hypothetical protein